MATRVSDGSITEQTTATAADTDLFAIEDGTDAKSISLGTLKEYTTLAHGQIAVTTADGAVTYTQCTADGDLGAGVATDNRTAISAAFDTAIANMPAVVEFGPGNFGIDGGMEIKPAAGSRGLTVKGQGSGTTKISFTKGSALTSGEFICFKVIPSVHPVTGRHKTTGNSASLITGGLVDSAYASGYTVVNLTDGSSGTITANTTTGVTATLVGGTDNDWDVDDEFEIYRTGGSRYEDNIYDVHFKDIGFYDDDPATHGTSEESHAISVQYGNNVTIENCSGESIGDEAFNFTFVNRGFMKGIDCVNCPSTGAGGGALTVQHGCRDIEISGCNLWGSSVEGTQSAIAGGNGINLEQTQLNFTGPGANSEDIVVSNCNIRDFGDIGIKIQCGVGGAEQKNITIQGNNIRGCDQGIEKGSTGDLSNLSISNNTISDMVEWGILFSGGPTHSFDISIADNIFADCVIGGIQPNMTHAIISNNVFKSCTRGIYIFNGVGINIVGGIFDDCGGTQLEEIEDVTNTEGGDSRCSNITILNSTATAAHIKGIAEVSGVILTTPNQTTEQQVAIRWADRVTNCTVEGGILLRTGAFNGGTKCVISGNTLGWSDTGPQGTGSAIELISGNDDCVISNNVIDMTGTTNNQYAVEILAGATNTVVMGNVLKVKSGATGFAIGDSGTGTLYEISDDDGTTVTERPLNIISE